ncbi:MAG: FAD-dependent oxidoreductase, partial [Verrucomicrobiota bacterium]
LADATGPRGFLHGALGLPAASFPGYPRTEALYTHLPGVRRWDSVHPAEGPLPYPPDDAALHHVFSDGWMWVLRFNNGLTSAGVSLGSAAAARLGLAEGAAAWDRLLAEYPAVARQFQDAHPVRPFIHHAPLAFRSGQAAGPRWIQLATAAGFLDPLLSTGFPLALLGIQRLASALEAAPGVPDLAPLGEAALADLDAAAGLVGALYRVFGDFDTFRELTLLYFAAASFTETARRLGRPELAPGFLLRGHPVFGPGLRNVAADAGSADPGALRDRIRRLVEPFDVAGLTEETRGHRHPCLAADLFRSAHKLGVDAPAIESMLRRTGFAGAP